jgi:23S rRNA (adenine2503-C2)-methyltransferase
MSNDNRDRIELLGLEPQAGRAALRDFFGRRGSPSYRADQVLHAVERGACEFDAISVLPLDDRVALAGSFSLTPLRPADVRISEDGTVKHLWALDDDELVESVLIPTADRTTLCISSQAGCALACAFCATGHYGFQRHLSAAEIVAQFRDARAWAVEHGLPPIGNIVFMGMGEPFSNPENVFPALTVLNQGFGVGARRITVSTVGVVPGIRDLARRPEQFRLAVSLHAPTHELRLKLVPIEKRWPIPVLMNALREFIAAGGKRLTFEYTMIRGVNDAPELADQLAELVRDLRPLVNLIPFNPIPYVDWTPSTPEAIAEFQARLRRGGVKAEVRQPRGRDVAAACGQLRASQAASRSP